MPPMVLLLSGAAGSGKSTLALAWCRRRSRAVRVELDAVREMILGGGADPQRISSLQREQYAHSARASVALARSFHDAGYDVVLTDVFEPEGLASVWRPLLVGLPWRRVHVRADLATTLRRAGERGKPVQERWIRSQHALPVPADVPVLETTQLSVEEAVEVLERLVDPPQRPAGP